MHTVGLSFQQIQAYDLFQLRTQMKRYRLFDTMKGADEAIKACETLMARLVRVLLDPTKKGTRREVPDVPFYLFGLGPGRRKLLYRWVVPVVRVVWVGG